MKEAPEALARLAGRELEYLQEAKPALERVIESELQAVIRRVDELMGQNALTPDLALQLWYQHRASAGFLRRLDGRMKMARVQLTQANRPTIVPTT